MTGSWIWLIGILAVGVAVFLLLPTTPETPTALAESPPGQVAEVSQSSQTGLAGYAGIPPVANAGRDLTLDEWEAVRLNGQGYDQSGGVVAYYWTAEGGRGFFDDSHQPQPLYTAPIICGCEECIVLTLTVTNAQGANTSDQMFVRVRGDPIRCPTTATTWGSCECPPSPCRKPCAPAVRTPDPCAPEPLPCEAPCVPYIAPAKRCEPAPVPCVCEPSCWPCEEPPCGPTVGYPWSVDVSAPCAPETRPAPHINRRYPAAVNEGGGVQLHGGVGNPGCRPACFLWAADKGWFDDPTSLDPIWYAPMSDRCGGEDACITLTVMDGCDGRGYDQIRIHINNLDNSRTVSR